MDVAVIGGGHGCYAAAADLAEQGHSVRFWRRDGEAFRPVLESGAVRLKDSHGVRDVPIARATTDLGDAVAGAELVVSPLPATAQADVAAQLAPHLSDGQVVFVPPGTFGSYLFSRWVRGAGNRAELAFAEAGTLPYLARKHPDGAIAITTRATRLPSGVFPARLAERAFAVLEQAFPAVERRRDALDAALLNYGPIIHPPLILLNAGPLQHFERWDIHNEGTQPFIRAVTDALDAERIALRAALGYGAPHFALAHHYDRGHDEKMYGGASHDRLTDSGDWRERIDLYAHRYMREDVACGLAFMVSLCEWAGVPCPVAGGLLAVASAGLGEDFRRHGRTVETTGLAGLGRQELRRLLDDGLGA